MTGPTLPHEEINAYLAFRVGRRTDLFGAFYDELWEPLSHGVCDELSILQDLNPFSKFSVGPVTIREGAERSYIMVRFQDRGSRLNVLGAMERWDFEVPGTTYEFVNIINGRRWKFLDSNMGRVVLPLLTRVADALGEYYGRKPYAKVQAGLIRWLECVDSTLLCVEVDDRGLPSRTGEMRSRYLVR